MSNASSLTRASIFLVVASIACVNPRASYEKNLKTWVGKPISEYIQANGAPNEIVKIPHKHDVYKFGGVRVVSWVETRNPQVISTTFGGSSTTNVSGNVYGGTNYASGTATSYTTVSPQSTVTTVIPGSSTKVSRYVGCEIWLYVRNGAIFEFSYEGNCY